MSDTLENKAEKPAVVKKVKKATAKKASRRFTLGVSMALNLENISKEREALVLNVMEYYSKLKSPNFDLALFAVGSSSISVKASADFGFNFTPFSNDNLGAKRNAGIQALVKSGECDAFIRVGSDDLVSLDLMEELVRRVQDRSRGFHSGSRASFLRRKG